MRGPTAAVAGGVLLGLLTTLAAGCARQMADGAGPVTIEPQAWAKVAASAEVVDKIVRERRTVYGVNTGVGLLADVRIPAADLEQLQRNVVRSHACGLGDPLSRFTRQELEELYRSWAFERDAHLGRLLSDQEFRSNPAVLNELLPKAPPTAQAAARRAMTFR